MTSGQDSRPPVPAEIDKSLCLDECSLDYVAGILAVFGALVLTVFPQTYNVDDSRGYDRRFDGIGAISGGGATSRLLVNYTEPQRTEILNYLFAPQYGVSLHILKVEIGGDAQSTDGAESSHMHEPSDENYERGYEFWLMKEAKLRNPDILLCGLPWAFPGWIGKGTYNAYANPEATADYIYRWILGARTHYELTIDYIGIWNERSFNATYIKTLRRTLDERGMSHVRICAPDDAGWYFAEALLSDPELAKAVDFIGSHYPNTRSTPEAVKTGKQLWASEDNRGLNDDMGGACSGGMINQNYINGMMTGTIIWNLISSYYDGLPYVRAGIMTANEPWSGHYVVSPKVWAIAHTTQFTKPGWYYLQHSSGVGNLTNGGTYVALTDRDAGSLTIIIETGSCSQEEMVPTDGRKLFTTACSQQPKVTPQTATFKLGGRFANVKQLNVWYTKFGSEGSPGTYFIKQQPIEVTEGMVELTLGVNVMYTLTTLSTGKKGAAPEPPPSKPFPLPYTDNFEGYKGPAEPNNFAQQIGVWENRFVGIPYGHVIRQVVMEHPVYWCWFGDNPDKPPTLNLIGNMNWTDIYVEVTARIGSVNGTDGVYVAARIDRGGCYAGLAEGIFFFVYPEKKQFFLTNDLARNNVILNGSIDAQPEWMTLSLLLKGNTASIKLNNKPLREVTIPMQPSKGFVGLGTEPYGIADFDDFHIDTAENGLKRLKDKARNSEKLFYEPKLNE